jgi:hypothetical protein
MELTIYTAITAGKDELRPPIASRPEVRYIAFMDDPVPVKGWEVRPAETRFADPCLNAKAHKIWPHLYVNTPVTLWVDGTHLPTDCFLDLVPFLLDRADIAVFAHPWRNCIYAEGEVCCDLFLDSPIKIQQQLSFYRVRGYPPHSGLFATGVVLRRDTPVNRRLSWMWWRQIRKYSRRDQISFPFVLWQLDIRPAIIPGDVYTSPWFVYKPHRR